MNTHDLKTWPLYFEAVWSGIKKFEVRKNDRDFEEGDTLYLKEYDPETDRQTGRMVMAKIVYLMVGGNFGIAEGYCVLGIEMLKKWR